MPNNTTRKYFITTSDGVEHGVSRDNFDSFGGAKGYAEDYPGATIHMVSPEDEHWDVDLNEYDEYRKKGFRLYATDYVQPEKKEPVTKSKEKPAEQTQKPVEQIQKSVDQKPLQLNTPITNEAGEWNGDYNKLGQAFGELYSQTDQGQASAAKVAEDKRREALNGSDKVYAKQEEANIKAANDRAQRRAQYEKNAEAIDEQSAAVEAQHNAYLAEKAKRDEEEYQKAREGGFWSTFAYMLTHADYVPTGSGVPMPKMPDATERVFQSAEHQLENARKRNDAARSTKRSDGSGLSTIASAAKNVGKGLYDAATSTDTYDHGQQNLQDAATLLYIKNKINNKKELTPDEQMYLSAVMLNDMVQSSTEEDLSLGYIAGETTANMAPFMLDMMVNPLKGLGKEASSAVVRQIVKKYGRAGLDTMKKRMLRRVATGILSEAAQVSGDVVSSMGLALTLQGMNTAADALGRGTGRAVYENGQITFVGDPVLDEDGNQVYKDGHPVYNKPDSWGTAVYKAIASGTIENATEMSENWGMGKALQKGLGKITPKFVRNLLDNASKDSFIKGITTFEKEAHWGGIIEEMWEEEEGIILNSIFTGDNKLSDLIDAKQQMEILAGVGLFGGALSGIKTGYMGAKAGYRSVMNSRYQSKVDRADAVVKSLGVPEWDKTRMLLDQADEKNIAEMWASVLMDKNYTPEQKKAIIGYASAVNRLHGFNTGSDIGQEGRNPYVKSAEAAHERGLSMQGNDVNASGARLRKLLENENTASYYSQVSSLVTKGATDDEVANFFQSVPMSDRARVSMLYESMSEVKGIQDSASANADKEGENFRNALVASKVSDDTDGVVRTAVARTEEGEKPVFVMSVSGNNAVVVPMGEDGKPVEGVSPTMMNASNLSEVTKQGLDDVVSARRQAAYNGLVNDLDFRLKHHAETQRPTVGMTLHNGTKEDGSIDDVVVVGINPENGNVQYVPAVFDAETGTTKPSSGAFKEMTEAEALALQDQYYNTRDAANTPEETDTETPAEQPTEQPEANTEQVTNPTADEILAKLSDNNGQEALAAYNLIASDENNTEEDILAAINNDIAEANGREIANLILQYHEALKAGKTQETTQPVATTPTQPVAETPTQPVVETPTQDEEGFPLDKDGDIDEAAIEQTGDVGTMARAYLKIWETPEEAHKRARDRADLAANKAKNKNLSGNKLKRQEKSAAYWRAVVAELLNGIMPKGANIDKTTMSQGFSDIQQKWQNASKVVGRAITRTLPDGTKLRGRIVLVEQGAATPSHDPHTFEAEAGLLMPNGQTRNSRDYKNNPKNQEAVVRYSQNYGSQALDNMPIISEDGVVWDGNNRVMSGQLAAENGTDASYLETLTDNADMYGFTADDIQGMSHPRAYFVPDAQSVIDAGLDYEPRSFDRFNAPEKKAESAVEKGIKMGKVLSDDTFKALAELVNRHGRLRDLYQSPASQAEVAQVLVSAPEIVDVNPSNLSDFFDETESKLTEAGRQLLESALIGYIFKGDAETLKRLSEVDKKVMTELADGMPELSVIRQNADYDISAEIAKAIEVIWTAKQSSMSVNDYLSQDDAYAGGTGKQVHGAVVSLIAKIISGGVKVPKTNEAVTLKTFLQSYMNDVSSAQGNMFAKDKVGALKSILNIFFPKEKFEDNTAEEEAKRKAEEEAKRKAEEEAKRKAEEEAKRKAEEEAKRKAEEEAKRKAEEEKRKQDLFAEAERLKAEAEAKRKAQLDDEIAKGNRFFYIYTEKGRKKYFSNTETTTRPISKADYDYAAEHGGAVMSPEEIKDRDDENEMNQLLKKFLATYPNRETEEVIKAINEKGDEFAKANLPWLNRLEELWEDHLKRERRLTTYDEKHFSKLKSSPEDAEKQKVRDQLQKLKDDYEAKVQPLRESLNEIKKLSAATTDQAELVKLRRDKNSINRQIQEALDNRRNEEERILLESGYITLTDEELTERHKDAGEYAAETSEYLAEERANRDKMQAELDKATSEIEQLRADLKKKTSDVIAGVKAIDLGAQMKKELAQRVEKLTSVLEEDMSPRKFQANVRAMIDYLETLTDELRTAMTMNSIYTESDEWNDFVELTDLVEQYLKSLTDWNTTIKEAESEDKHDYVNDAASELHEEMISPEEEDKSLLSVITLANQILQGGTDFIDELDDAVKAVDDAEAVIESNPGEVKSYDSGIKENEENINRVVAELNALQAELDKRGIEYERIDTKKYEPTTEEPAKGADSTNQPKEKNYLEGVQVTREEAEKNYKDALKAFFDVFKQKRRKALSITEEEYQNLKQAYHDAYVTYHKFIEDSLDKKSKKWLAEQEEALMKDPLEMQRAQLRALDNEGRRSYLLSGFVGDELELAKLAARENPTDLRKVINKKSYFTASKLKKDEQARVCQIVLDRANAIINAYVENKNKVRMEEVKRMFDNFNTDADGNVIDEDMQKVFDKIYAVMRVSGLSVRFIDNNSNIGGNAYTNGLVQYGSCYLYNPDTTDEYRRNLIVHELIHTITQHALYAHKNSYRDTKEQDLYILSPEMIEAAEELMQIWSVVDDRTRKGQDFVRYGKPKGDYGTKNEQEMTADIFEMRPKMKRMGLWERFLNAIHKFFDENWTESTEDDDVLTNGYNAVLAALDKMLSNFVYQDYETLQLWEGASRIRKTDAQVGYHGSGSLFDKFRLSFLSSGAGAQSFGYGIYIANNESMAKSYAANPNRAIKERIMELKQDREDAVKRIEERLNDYIKTEKILRDRGMTDKADFVMTRIKTLQATLDGTADPYNNELLVYDNLIEEEKAKLGSYVYTVEIPDDKGSNYFDYAGEHSAEELNKIIEAAKKFPHTEALIEMLQDKIKNDKTTMNLPHEMAAAMGVKIGDKKLSDILSAAGFVGSRVNMGFYVIYDPANAVIVDTNNIGAVDEGKPDSDFKTNVYNLGSLRGVERYFLGGLHDYMNGITNGDNNLVDTDVAKSNLSVHTRNNKPYVKALTDLLATNLTDSQREFVQGALDEVMAERAWLEAMANGKNIKWDYPQGAITNAEFQKGELQYQSEDANAKTTAYVAEMVALGKSGIKVHILKNDESYFMDSYDKVILTPYIDGRLHEEVKKEINRIKKKIGIFPHTVMLTTDKYAYICSVDTDYNLTVKNRYDKDSRLPVRTNESFVSEEYPETSGSSSEGTPDRQGGRYAESGEGTNQSIQPGGTLGRGLRSDNGDRILDKERIGFSGMLPLTNQGGNRIYGWSIGGEIFLTEDGINSETPVHEYTHLWCIAMQKRNNRAWNSIVDLLKGTSTWNDVVNNGSYANLSNDDRIASEVLSRLSGKHAAQILEEEAKKEQEGSTNSSKALSLLDNVKKALNQFWSWVGKDIFNIEKFTSIDDVKNRVLYDFVSGTDLGDVYSDQVEFSIVTDQKTIDELESSPKITGYRNVVLRSDGTFGSPMASGLRSKGKQKAETKGFELDKWEQAEENPDLANEKGKIDLVKPDGKSVTGVDYNPYIHNRPNKVNKQFKQAWERPDLVYIETEIPTTDLESGYHAEKAAKSVGVHNWPTPSSSQKLILSRYDKPVRIVPWEEVADDWVEEFKDRGVEFDIVPPGLLPILAERGVKILPPHKGMGETCEKAYNDFVEGGVRFMTAEQAETDKEYMEAVNSGDMEKAQKMVDEAAENAGNTVEGYHGTTNNFFVFDKSKASKEGNWGGGFYFTNNEDDVEANYANNDGPDLTAKIEHYAEQMEWMDGYEDMDYEERLKEARKKFSEGEPRTISAYLNIQNPVIVGGPNQTFFDLNENYNEETDEFEGPTGLLVDFLTTLNGIIKENEWNDELLLSDICEFGEEGLTAQQLEDKVREILDLSGYEDAEGNMATGDAMRRAFEKMGFDGIVDNTVNLKFGSQREYGKGMSGMDEDTVHVIVFEPNQIKSADPVTYDNEGNVIPLSQRFNQESNDIRYKETEKQPEQHETGTDLTGVVTNVASALNTPVTIVNNAAELDAVEWMGSADKAAMKKKGMAAYDPKTGNVVVYMPHINNAKDAATAILHEVVGHLGLRNMLGKEKYDAAMMALFNRLPDSVRKHVVDTARAKYKGDVIVALDEYLAEQAQLDETPTWWDKVVSAVRGLLREWAGFDFTVSENDVKYLLWQSKNLLQKGDILGEAEQRAMRKKLGINEKSLEADRLTLNFINKFTSRYNGIPVELRSTAADLSLVDFFGASAYDTVTERTLNAMLAKALVKEKVNKIRAIQSAHRNKMFIFADVIEKNGVENLERTLFHENIHGFFSRKFGTERDNLPFAEKFYNDNGKDFPEEKKKADRHVGRKYEEFIAYSLSNAMQEGTVKDFLERFDEEGKQIINEFLNDFGYDPENEGKRRLARGSRADGQSEGQPGGDWQPTESDLSEEVRNEIDNASDEESIVRFMEEAQRNPNGLGPVSETTAEQWNDLVTNLEFMLSEVSSDHLLSVKTFQDFLAEKTGTPITSMQDCYNALLAVQSKSHQETKTFDRKYVTKLNSALIDLFGYHMSLNPMKWGENAREWRRRFRMGTKNWDLNKNPLLAEANQYLATKHGIERNRDLAANNVLIPKAQKMADEQLARATAEDDKAIEKLLAQIEPLKKQAQEADRIAKESKARADELLAKHEAEKAAGATRWNPKDKAERERLMVEWHHNVQSRNDAVEELKPLNKELGERRKHRADIIEHPKKYTDPKTGKTLMTETECIEQVMNEWYDKLDEVRNNSEFTWEQQQRAMDAMLEEIGAEINDYSGLSDWYFGEESWYEAAYQMVTEYEAKSDPEKLENLWKAIEGINKYAIEKQEKSGLAKNGFVDRQSRRFQFFVPLRGHDADSAEKHWDYIRGEAREGANPVHPMKGRKTKPANCFVSMTNVAYKSINFGNKNTALKAFYYLVKAHPTDIAKVVEGWAEWKEVEPGKFDWVAVEPEFPDKASDDEVAGILNAFEKNMRERLEMGDNVKRTRDLHARVPYRFESKAHENEHIVTMHVNGNKVKIVIGANPRVSQALTGMLNPGLHLGEDREKLKEWIGVWSKLMNFKAGVLTSLNINFTTGNINRDSFFSLITSEVRFGKEFAKRFRRHQGYFIGAYAKWAMMGRMLYKYNKGDYDDEANLNEREKRFKSFLDNGGATGYSWSVSMEETQRTLEQQLKELNSMNPLHFFTHGWNAFFSMVELVTEASELVNRFAAYEAGKDLGWSERDCIVASKEITLNFNRKGAGLGGFRAVKPDMSDWEKTKVHMSNVVALYTGVGQGMEIFFNAGMQDKFLLWTMFRTAPKKFIEYGVVLPTLLGAFMPIMNQVALPFLYALLFGDDNDDEYYDLSDYERQHYLQIRLPHGNWVKFAIPQGVAPWYAIGDVATGALSGERQMSAMDVVQPMCDLVFPLSMNVENMDSPHGFFREMMGSTIISGLVDILVNKDFIGRKIVNTKKFGSEREPSYLSATRNTNELMVAFAKWMNEKAGGNEVEPAPIVGRFNPAYVDHIARDLPAGYYVIPMDIATVIWKYVHRNDEEAMSVGSMFETLGLTHRNFLSGSSDAKDRRLRSQYYQLVVDDYREREDFIKDYNSKYKDANRKGDTLRAAQLASDYKKLVTDDYQKVYEQLTPHVKAISELDKSERRYGIKPADEVRLGHMLEALDIVREPDPEKREKRQDKKDKLTKAAKELRKKVLNK